MGLLNRPFRFEIRFQIFALSPKVAKNGLGGKFDLRGCFEREVVKLGGFHSFEWDFNGNEIWFEWDSIKNEWKPVKFFNFPFKLNGFPVKFEIFLPFSQSFQWESYFEWEENEEF